MNKVVLFFLIITLPLSSKASYLENVSFINSTIIIQHNGCYLKRLIEEQNKLILVLDDCKTIKGKVTVSHPNVIDIHWAQHDKEIVWLVITFLNEYNFNINLSRHQYKICVSDCEPPAAGFLRINGILLQIPIQNMSISDFLDNSIGFLPKNIVKDGLPHFGAKRDDWHNIKRSHRGYDIYVNNINIVAAAYGKVTKVRQNERAGLYVKLHHENQLDTIYVHLKKSLVIEGQIVQAGDIIGKIDGPVGNAIDPQLHFEIKQDNKSIDPLPFIEQFYKLDSDITNKINKYKKLLINNIIIRNNQVKKFLNTQ